MLTSTSPRFFLSSTFLPYVLLVLNLLCSPASPASATPSPRVDRSRVLSSRDYISQSSLATSYDYVVVGGGAAGLVIASRLSEDPSVSVLLLEAGGVGNDVKEIVDTPSEAYYNGLGGVAAYSWGYQSVAQTSAGNRTVTMPRAKILGGCSAMNGMYYIQPSSQELDAWGNLVKSSTDNANDAAVWSWDSLYPAMKKTTTFIPPLQEVQEQAKIKYVASSHGDSGPMRTSYSAMTFPIVGAWTPTLAAAGGIPATGDAYSGENLGGYIAALSINPSNWTRSYPKPAYIDGQPPRSNLAILADATVTRLVFASDSSTTVSGVEFASNKDARKQVVGVGKEVILSAGAIGSPQVLMTSGIGPKDVLDAAGVPVKVDLPGVGQHLQDHLAASIVWDTVDDTPGNIKASGSDVSKSPEFLSFVNAATAYINATRIFGSSSANADFTSTITRDADTYALPLIESTDSTVRAGYKAVLQLAADLVSNDNLGAIEAMLNINVAGKASITVALQRPFSHGSVKITSSSVFDAPAIDPRYLSHAADTTLLRESLKLAQTLGNTVPLSDYLKLDTMVPSPVNDVPDDAAWDKWIADHATTQYHLSSTCSMLPKELGGVVDSKLRVYGLANVRVADASVLPFELSAHLAAPTYGLGEKAVDVILNRVVSNSTGSGSSNSSNSNTPDQSKKDTSSASMLEIPTRSMAAVVSVVALVFGMLVL